MTYRLVICKFLMNQFYVFINYVAPITYDQLLQVAIKCKSCDAGCLLSQHILVPVVTNNTSH